MLIPWQFQKEAIQTGIDYIKGDSTDPSILIMPTGTGKSLVIANMVKGITEPCIILQPSIELLKQNYERFCDYGGLASIYSSSMSKFPSSTTFATLDSIKDKGRLFQKYFGSSVLFVDECHYKYPPEPGSMFTNFLADLRPTKILGLTASPLRLYPGVKGGPTMLKMLTKSNPSIYKEIIHVTQIGDVCEEYWTPMVYVSNQYDGSKLVYSPNAAEFTEESIRETANYNNVNSKIFNKVKSQLNDGYTDILVFVDSIETGEKMAANTPHSVFISGKTNKAQRADWVEKFKLPNNGNKEIRVLFNYGTFTTGFDHKPLQSVITGRPSNSWSLIYQMFCRGCRRDASKTQCIVNDYCGNIDRHGIPNNIRFENREDIGWCMTDGNILKSGVDIREKVYVPPVA